MAGFAPNMPGSAGPVISGGRMLPPPPPMVRPGMLPDETGYLPPGMATSGAPGMQPPRPGGVPPEFAQRQPMAPRPGGSPMENPGQQQMAMPQRPQMQPMQRPQRPMMDAQQAQTQVALRHLHGMRGRNQPPQAMP